jgi:hypothetical protein
MGVVEIVKPVAFVEGVEAVMLAEVVGFVLGVVTAVLGAFVNGGCRSTISFVLFTIRNPFWSAMYSTRLM